ncbi:tetratricopeptide repeat protein [Paludisphaera soli]|uniref:tetratricopeptide repeat protein n=1 Tax=Paludisphaera soli TaxID=2712865 RepID=UPI0013EB9BC7|nr:tetratricopeptide repeat protein [Paludisphaera soli]
MRAQVLCEAGRFAEARRAFAEARDAIRAALRRTPDSAELWRFLGQAYHGDGRYAEAVGPHRHSLALAPDSTFDGRLLAESLLDAARWTSDPEA